MNTENIKNCKGFNLIELLVVVLIIGILAAIALPKYQLIKDKAKYTQAMTLLAAINSAQSRYMLNMNTYTDNFNNLDIDLPSSGIIRNYSGINDYYEDSWGNCLLHGTGYGRCTITIGKYSVWYFLWWDKGLVNSNMRQCWVLHPENNERGQRLCKAMTGKEGYDSGEYRKYNFY